MLEFVGYVEGCWFFVFESWLVVYDGCMCKWLLGDGDWFLIELVVDDFVLIEVLD